MYAFLKHMHKIYDYKNDACVQMMLNDDRIIEHSSYRAVKYTAYNAFNVSIENLKHGYTVEYTIEHMKKMMFETNACIP